MPMGDVYSYSKLIVCFLALQLVGSCCWVWKRGGGERGGVEGPLSKWNEWTALC